MLNGWISLQVKDPQRVAEWYTKYMHLEVIGGRPDIGSQALGTKENGAALILRPGEGFEKPEMFQIHFHVPNVDAEYERLKTEGLDFLDSPKDMPWGWRHAYTRDPAGHTVEICSPLPEANFDK